MYHSFVATLKGINFVVNMDGINMVLCMFVIVFLLFAEFSLVL